MRPPSPMLPLSTRPWVSLCGASRFTAMTASQRASSMLANSLSRVMPGVVDEDVGAPAVMFAKVRGDLADGVGGGDVERQGCTVDPVRRPGKGFAACSTSIAMTATPSRANTSAMVAPMPRAAPVTIATCQPVGLSQAGAESAAPTENTWPSTVGGLPRQDEAQRRLRPVAAGLRQPTNRTNETVAPAQFLAQRSRVNPSALLADLLVVTDDVSEGVVPMTTTPSTGSEVAQYRCEELV